MKEGLTWEAARPEVSWFDPFFLTMANSVLRAPAGAFGARPKLLHLGCGTGVKTETLRRMGYEAVGIDLDEELLEHARRSFPQTRFLQGDIQNLAFADSTFDVVFS